MDRSAPAPLRRPVPPSAAGERLDRLVSEWYAPLARSRVQAWIREGRVTLDGAVATRPATAVDAGQLVAVDPPEAEAPAEAFGGALRVVFEDEHVLAIDKPAGQIVHPRPGDGRGDSVAELAERLHGPLPRLQGDERPGVVHRLDAGTSGVMVLARTEAAAVALVEQFRARTVEKVYVALVQGDPRFDSEWIDARIERHPRSPERMRIAAAGEGRDAETYYEVRERFGASAFLECRPRTGRTHQIRVHLEHVGLPILGDRLYTGGRGRRPAAASLPRLERQALHAARLSFDHPAGGERLTVEAPLAPDLAAALASLRAAAG